MPHGRIKLPTLALGCTNCGVCEARPFICGFVGPLEHSMDPMHRIPLSALALGPSRFRVVSGAA